MKSPARAAAKNRDTLLLGPEIDDKRFVQVRTQEFAEFLVSGMDEVSVAILVGNEGQKEAVSVTLSEIFRADVGAPFESANEIDFCRKGAEGVFHLLDLLRGSSLLELKQDDVAQKLFLGYRLRRRGGCEQSQQYSRSRKEHLCRTETEN